MGQVLLLVRRFWSIHDPKYSYDANGNNVRIAKPGEVKKMKYDELNRMTQWRKTGSGQPTMERSVYRGAEWHRASQTANGVTTSYLYDGDNVAADVVAGNIGTAYVTPFLDQNLSMTKGGSTYYYTQDGLGSVRTLTDANGIMKNSYDYSAYGETYVAGTTETITNRYQYTGREKNAVSGLQYNRHRFYNNGIGRWTTRDPIGYAGGIGLYEYAMSSPTFWVDPTGESVVGMIAVGKYIQRVESKMQRLIDDLLRLKRKTLRISCDCDAAAHSTRLFSKRLPVTP